MTGRYVRSTFVEDQREFVEHLQIGKQIGKLLDMPKRPQAQKHIFWVWNMRNLETWFQLLKSLKNHKDAYNNSVQNGCDAFPNQLTRFRFEATPILDKVQNTVNTQSSFKPGSDL